MAAVVKKIYWDSVLIALILYYHLMPYFVWSIPGREYVTLFLDILLGLLCFKRFKRSNKNNGLFTLYWLAWLVYVFTSLFNSVLNINGIITSIPYIGFVYVALMEDREEKRVLYYFLTVYTAIIVLSMLVWFMARFGVIQSIGTIQHYNPSLDRSFSVYPLLLIEHFNILGMRFSGPFDEPGVVGTVGALLLCVSKFNFKNWRTWAVLISGILSMSFFFYAAIAIYWLFYLVFSRKSYFSATIVALLFAVFFFQTSRDDYFSEKLWARFEWDSSTGKFVGDNRSKEEADAYYESKMWTSEYFWGLNNNSYYWSMAFGSSSYKNVIMRNGAIFLLFYVGFFVLLGLRNRKSWVDFFLFAFILFVNMYQRCDIYYPSTIFLYACMARQIQPYENNLSYSVKRRSSELRPTI